MQCMHVVVPLASISKLNRPVRWSSSRCHTMRFRNHPCQNTWITHYIQVGWHHMTRANCRSTQLADACVAAAKKMM
jgi:hypothetical protein